MNEDVSRQTAEPLPRELLEHLKRDATGFVLKLVDDRRSRLDEFHDVARTLDGSIWLCVTLAVQDRQPRVRAWVNARHIEQIIVPDNVRSPVPPRCD